MLRPLLNDIAQRMFTLNKCEQRRFLLHLLQENPLPRNSRILDFGCGTGLFFPVFRQLGLRYFGYDIDPDLTAYASRRYSEGTFTATFESLSRAQPFALILANCCFHHIPDPEEELARLASLLPPTGRFLLIDLLLKEPDPSACHRLFMKLEQGRSLRTAPGYRAMLAGCFRILAERQTRSHFLSLAYRWNPVANDMVVLLCEKVP